MTLYRLDLEWWGRVQMTRHYSARNAQEAIRFAREDGHRVWAVFDQHNALLWRAQPKRRPGRKKG